MLGELIPELVQAAPNTRFTAFLNREAAAAPGGPWKRSYTHCHGPSPRQKSIRMGPRGAAAPATSSGTTRRRPGPQPRQHGPCLGTIPSRGHDSRPRIPHCPGGTSGACRPRHAGTRPARSTSLTPCVGRRCLHPNRPASATEGFTQQGGCRPTGGRHRSTGHTGARAQLRAQYGAGSRQIVLSVSAKRPHKNLARLIGALSLIPAERRPLLILPGYSTSHEYELRRRAKTLAVVDDIRFLGWVSPTELEGLYAAASCFVFPSLLEGFGLPVLEAMARGLPVACSSRGALAEVAGDAALRFNPESEPEIAAAIERLLSDPTEAKRLGRAGRERAAEFSWKSTAEGTLATYSAALR